MMSSTFSFHNTLPVIAHTETAVSLEWIKKTMGRRTFESNAVTFI